MIRITLDFWTYLGKIITLTIKSFLVYPQVYFFIYLDLPYTWGIFAGLSIDILHLFSFVSILLF